MKIIDGSNAILGRLASYAAKQALKGEEVVIVNAEKVIILGNKENIRKRYLEKRERVGSGQKGPKVSTDPEKIMKRAIRGMLPDHRRGRGKVALRKIKCYKGIPEKFRDVKKISGGKEKVSKYIKIDEVYK